MKGFVTNIEKDSLANDYFRKVLYTSQNSQLVLMSLNPGEEIGEEIHELDQFIRVEAGKCKAVLDGQEFEMTDGFSIVVPQGSKHNIINTGDSKLKLYTVYSPANHKDGTIHQTKADAEANEEHFDGKLSY